MLKLNAAPSPPEVAAAAGFDCLHTPELTGFEQRRAWLVDRIKRAALRQLHRSAAGERLLLRMYLVGEEATECALLGEWSGAAQPWLAEQVQRHLNDERQHAAAFARALQERGHTPTISQNPDRLSQRKIAQWRRLGQDYAGRFEQGLLVPAYAIGLCAEQMAMRVLQRHCQVLEEQGAQQALYPLLQRVLRDESRHVALCQQTLRRLVQPAETQALAQLLGQVRAIDASFGVSGAVAMYVAGWTLAWGRR